MNRRHRLRGRSAFAAVRARRAAGVSAALRVGVAPNGGDAARVGFAIPRALGGAVERNRLRRRLRAAVREQLDLLAGLDAVISASPPAARLRWPELRSQLHVCVVSATARSGAPARRP